MNPKKFLKPLGKLALAMSALTLAAGDVYAQSRSDVSRLNVTPDYVPGELLVKYKANTSSRTVGAMMNKYGATTVKAFQSPRGLSAAAASSIGLDRWQQVRVARDSDLQELRRELSADPSVERVEFNYILKTSAVPNDPLFGDLWGMHNLGQTGGVVDADIDAPEAWDVQTGSGDVIVGVIDTGVDYTHPDLAANMWTNPGEIPGNGIDDDGNGYVDDVYGYDFVNNDSDPMDDNGHGTHCAGTIAAVGNNGVGVAGVAWEAKIMALKFLDAGGSGSTDAAISAVTYATNMGAHITNNSWGGGGFSQALLDAIIAANAANSLFVAAAGNSNSNNDAVDNYPSNYDVDNVLAVAALDHNDARATFSSYGLTTVDLGAPGVDILSTALTSGSISDPSGYTAISGTSMATPHVAGAAALVLSEFPELSAIGIKARLMGTVRKIASMEGVTVTGGALNISGALDDDSIAPAAIADLSSSSPGSSTVALSWTATGDDGLDGNASTYDIRVSSSPIDDTNFDEATSALYSASVAQGEVESYTVGGLDENATYYFAIKAIDNVGNTSGISNTATATTLAAVTVFEENFNDIEDWSIAGTEGPEGFLWHLGSHRFNSETTALYYGVDSTLTYDTGSANNGIATSAPIDLTDMLDASLSFYHFLETEGLAPYDTATVSISKDGGETWTEVYSSAFGTNGEMVKESFDISSYAGEVIQVRFGFDTVDGIFNNFEGWVVDDLVIKGAVESVNLPPVASLSIDPSEVTEGWFAISRADESYDPEGAPLTYYFSYSDTGETEISENPSDFHTYLEPGVVRVTLFVYDGVQFSEPVFAFIEVKPIIADLGGPYVVPFGEYNLFDASNSTKTSQYFWDFGDGETLMSFEPYRYWLYEKPGRYTANITINVGSASEVGYATVDVVPGYGDEFGEYLGGDDPENWLDTDANNSLEENDALFKIVEVDGEAVFGSAGPVSNAHSHYVGDQPLNVSGAYEYTGRMMGSDSIGVTFFSKYPSSAGYYTLRTLGSDKPFFIDARGAVVEGVTNSGVSPDSLGNGWVKFRIQVQNTGDSTQIRANVWADGTDEPAGWQMEAVDSRFWRLKSGTFGVWADGEGSQYWDDLSVVSIGELPEAFVVPDTSGLQIADAVKVLEEAGLELSFAEYDFHDFVPAGEVWSQLPATGSVVYKGEAVKLFVSSGPVEYIEVPDVTGVVLWQAELDLLVGGLAIAEVSNAYSDTVPEGHIISQTPGASEWLIAGAGLSVVVSLGPQP